MRAREDEAVTTPPVLCNEEQLECKSTG